MGEIMIPVNGNDSSLYEEIIRENLEDRVLVLNQEITESIIEDYSLHILKWNRQDKCLPVENRKPITIYINSVGGSSIDGFGGLVDIILASKTKVIGVCLGMAASMAYHVYLACHERIAFPHSILLQHDGEICVQNSTSKARQTMEFFNNMEKRVKEYVLSRTKMTEDFYDNIYDQEYWFYADSVGKELGCVDKIVGVDIELDEIL